MEERRAGEACLLEKVQHHGDALARIEALIGPGASQDVDSVAESAAEEDCAKRPPLEKSSTVGLSVRVSSALFEEDGSSMHSRCRMMVHQRRRFAVCTSCLIVANSIFLGLEANATITSSGLTTPDGIAWRLANAFFALAFLVELVVRWVSDGAAFFLLPRNSDCFWNWMDTLLILITVIEEILRYFTVDVITFGFLRLSRLLRVTRMMRAFKVVREFKELKTMVTGLLNCAKPLFWAGVLLACLTHLIGVLIAQLLTEYLRSVQDRDLDAEDAHAIHYITRNLPNLWESMCSRFEALTGGRDWGEIARPFRHIHFVLTWCLVLYIVIGIFCILNLLSVLKKYGVVGLRAVDTRPLNEEFKDCETTTAEDYRATGKGNRRGWRRRLLERVEKEGCKPQPPPQKAKAGGGNPLMAPGRPGGARKWQSQSLTEEAGA
ncbi:unnamed protein product [Prorocentrum cordatum]|uniref:Ion transport domain-containing protein n=1 Tax=Prorocentrum cordatum TaxID=2364126 RepID=A0ABN9QYB7_9DINO|nr:unnamed protein product [Polarella glacialis]